MKRKILVPLLLFFLSSISVYGMPYYDVPGKHPNTTLELQNHIDIIKYIDSSNASSMYVQSAPNEIPLGMEPSNYCLLTSLILLGIIATIIIRRVRTNTLKLF